MAQSCCVVSYDRNPFPPTLYAREKRICTQILNGEKRGLSVEIFSEYPLNPDIQNNLSRIVDLVEKSREARGEKHKFQAKSRLMDSETCSN
jgi:hypothetical protein